MKQICKKVLGNILIRPFNAQVSSALRTRKKARKERESSWTVKIAYLSDPSLLVFIMEESLLDMVRPLTNSKKPARIVLAEIKSCIRDMEWVGSFHF